MTPPDAEVMAALREYGRANQKWAPGAPAVKRTEAALLAAIAKALEAARGREQRVSGALKVCLSIMKLHFDKEHCPRSVFEAIAHGNAALSDPPDGDPHA